MKKLALVLVIVFGMVSGYAQAGPPSPSGGTGTDLSAVPLLTSTASGLLSAEVNLGGLTTGLLLNTVAIGTGTVSSFPIGTMTNGKYCKYVTGSGVVCDSDVATDSITITAAPANQTASGAVMAVTSAAAFALGDLLYLNSDGKAAKARADSSTTMPAVCIATQTATEADQSKTCLRLGQYRDDDLYNLTKGGVVYVSGATAGAATQTAPSTSSHWVQPVGVGFTADVLWFSPTLIMIQVP